MPTRTFGPFPLIPRTRDARLKYGEPFNFLFKDPR